MTDEPFKPPQYEAGVPLPPPTAKPAITVNKPASFRTRTMATKPARRGKSKHGKKYDPRNPTFY